MPNKVTRYFFPVGHGAFYMEDIDGYKYVFDCGSMRSPSVAESRINHYLAPNMAIEAVFISHWHSHQINGLERLLEWCQVKRVFLPLLSPEERLVLASANIRTFERELILNPEKTIAFLHPDTKVTYITGLSPGDLDKPSLFQPDPHKIIPIDEIGPDQKLNPCVAVRAKNYPDWMFLPYILPGHLLRDRFQAAVRDLLGKRHIDPAGLTERDWPALLSDRHIRAELQRVYRDSAMELHVTSTVVYSGPISAGTRKWGALYLSGFHASDENWECLVLQFRQYFSNLSVLTVPNHGSKLNFNANIAHLDCDKIISAKPNTPQLLDLPHADVVLALKRGNGNYYICSMKSGKRYTYQRGKRGSVKDVRYYRKEI